LRTTRAGMASRPATSQNKLGPSPAANTAKPPLLPGRKIHFTMRPRCGQRGLRLRSAQTSSQPDAGRVPNWSAARGAGWRGGAVRPLLARKQGANAPRSPPRKPLLIHIPGNLVSFGQGLLSRLQHGLDLVSHGLEVAQAGAD